MKRKIRAGRFLFIFIALIILLILLYIIWWHLPVKINRAKDIKFGEQVIKNIESFRQLNDSLPGNYDWSTFEKLGFEFNGESPWPEYQKISDSTFELQFIEGFDGPYLSWSSDERNWKLDY